MMKQQGNGRYNMLHNKFDNTFHKLYYNTMDSLNLEVMKIILDEVGHHTCPIKFYKMRMISKSFKSIIDNYTDGFYHYFKNEFGICNNTYKSIIESKINIGRPISMKYGFSIIKLDDWSILMDKYKYGFLSYPKYVEIKDHVFVYMYEYKNISNNRYPSTTANQRVSHGHSDNEIEMNIKEKYYNLMEKYEIIFANIKRKNIEYGNFIKKYSNSNPYENIVIWLRNNGELKRN